MTGVEELLLSLPIAPERKAKLIELAKAQALGQVLSEWDVDRDYDSIIELLESGEGFDLPEDIVIWYPYQEETYFSVAGAIQDAYNNSLRTVMETSRILLGL